MGSRCSNEFSCAAESCPVRTDGLREDMSGGALYEWHVFETDPDGEVNTLLARDENIFESW